MDVKQLEKRCQDHWLDLNINDPDCLKNQIKAIFERCEHQREAFVEIYRLVLPDWDKIEKVSGFPEAGNELWKFICRQFIEFDGIHHPDVFKGGLWMNNGFSSNGNLSPWEISFENCTVTLA